MFIGSPDMMSRNLKHRVEIICPVHERKAKNAIINRILPTFNSLIQPNGMFWNRTASTCRPNIPIRVLVRSRCLLQCERSGGSLEKTDQQQVYEAASRITEDFGHANQVCRLSLAIYDDLSAVHGFGKQTRRLLAAAALLHDIGWSVAASPHHKTGMTFIAEDRTLPFSPRERILAALAVRYHRGLLPKKRHQLYCTLSLSLSTRSPHCLSDCRYYSGCGRIGPIPLRRGQISAHRTFCRATVFFLHRFGQRLSRAVNCRKKRIC